MGDGRCTAWSSIKISSFQAIISCDQWKSFKNVIYTFSAPSQAYLSLAGLLKVLNIFCNSDNKNFLPQLAGPTIKMFLNLPLPLVRSSLMATTKATHFTLFPWKTSRVQRCQLPQHSSTHYFSRDWQMISIQCFCCLWVLVAASSIFQVVVTRSCRTFGDLPRINFLRSSFPSKNCSCALAINSSSVLMLLATRNSHISIFCKLLVFGVDKLLVNKLWCFQHDCL